MKTPVSEMMFQQRTADTIKEHGLMILNVFGTELDDSIRPSFAYTIGLFERFGFEILTFSLPSNVAGNVFNLIYKKLIEGETIEYTADDRRWIQLSPSLGAIGKPVRFYRCNNKAHEYTLRALKYYGRTDIPVIQMVLPDRRGKFPGDQGFDNDYMTQLQPTNLYDPRQPQKVAP